MSDADRSIAETMIGDSLDALQEALEEDVQVTSADPETPKKNYRTGKKSISGWVDEGLVDWAKSKARQERRALQNVIERSLAEAKEREEKEFLSQQEAFPPSHILIKDREMSVEVRVSNDQSDTTIDQHRGFAIDFRRGVAVAYLGDGEEREIPLPEAEIIPHAA